MKAIVNKMKKGEVLKVKDVTKLKLTPKKVDEIFPTVFSVRPNPESKRGKSYFCKVKFEDSDAIEYYRVLFQGKGELDVVEEV